MFHRGSSPFFFGYLEQNPYLCTNIPYGKGQVITDRMKNIKQYAGIYLILLGTLTLLLTRLNAWSGHNWLLLTGLLLIVAGIVTHIWSIKRESKY